MGTIKRTWDVEEKAPILKGLEKTGGVEGCRKHGLYPSTYYEWKKKNDEQGVDGHIPHYDRKKAGKLRKIKKENEKLKKLLTEKELELSIKSELLKKRWHSGRAQRNS